MHADAKTLGGRNQMLARGARIKNAVAKPTHAIVHGNGHFHDGAERAIAATKAFHNQALPSKQMP